MGHVTAPRALGARQQHRDDVEIVVAFAPVDRDLHFLLLPWPQPARTQEHHARPAVAECLGQSRLELPTWDQIPSLQVE